MGTVCCSSCTGANGDNSVKKPDPAGDAVEQCDETTPVRTLTPPREGAVESSDVADIAQPAAAQPPKPADLASTSAPQVPKEGVNTDSHVVTPSTATEGSGVDAPMSSSGGQNGSTNIDRHHSDEAAPVSAPQEVDPTKKAALEEMIANARDRMRNMYGDREHHTANRFGDSSQLPEFKPAVHVPVLALINADSGARAGDDILRVARNTPYYQDRFFNIMHVVKGQAPGQLLDVFRRELNAAKDEAKKLGVRPRVISGGGDGTGSFALFIVFLALRAKPSRNDGEDLEDRGNGFIWTDEEMADLFPAIAQLPLGSANDFAHILGWGHKYPGASVPAGGSCCYGTKIAALSAWIDSVISQASQVVNFDIWGIMPPPGQSRCNFKVCALTGNRGISPRKRVDGKQQLVMKEAPLPPPFFVCLYFTAGFMAYVVARFALNRHGSALKNKLEYVKQGAAILLERTPPQLKCYLDGVEVKCDSEPYFPPRGKPRSKGRNYSDVGFYNINWQAGILHGADRRGLLARLLTSRTPVVFNDGLVDMMRIKGIIRSFLKNPGPRVQVDKRKDMTLNFEGGPGQGIFFQWDGEVRLAFSPSGEPLDMHIRRVMSVPVVMGPHASGKLTGKLDNGKPVRFEFIGDTPAAVSQAKDRVLMYCDGELAQELNATKLEIELASLHLEKNTQ